MENNLFSYCIDMDVRYFGLSAADVLLFAYQLAVRIGLPPPFSKDKAATRNKWLKGFVRRHQPLYVRPPLGISVARMRLVPYSFTQGKT
jgi:hypothetical protein